MSETPVPADAGLPERPAPLLRVEDIAVQYGVVRAVQGVSIEARPGEIVAVVGPNGAGKSSLLRATYGITKARGGRVFVGDTDVTKLRPDLRLRQHGIALVPEGRGVLTRLTVAENLTLGARMGAVRRPERSADERWTEVTSLFPVLEERADQLAGTLSGGEQQMLSVARALLCEPTILLLDEPSIGLAPLVVRRIFDSLRSHLEGKDLAVLLVEQNTKLALDVASYGYVLERGRLEGQGSSQELRADPALLEAYLGKVAVPHEPGAPDNR